MPSHNRVKTEDILTYLYEYIQHQLAELYEIFINYRPYVLSINLFNPMLKLD